MSIYDNSRDFDGRRRDFGGQAYAAEQAPYASYGPSWLWVVLAGLSLLAALVIGVGIAYSDSYDRTRAFDNGTRLEYQVNDVTMGDPSVPLNYGLQPEQGAYPADNRPSRSPVFPEDGPALANDGY